MQHPLDKALIIVTAALIPCGICPAQEAKPAPAPQACITVDPGKPGVMVSPTLYGIFFEEINRAGDGGLYAELLQNRSFEDAPDDPRAWTLLKEGNADARITLDKSQPLNPNNPTSLRLEVVNPNSGRAGICNEGFKGRPLDYANLLAAYHEAVKKATTGLCVEAGKDYQVSFYARCGEGFKGPLTVSIEKQDGTVLASRGFTDIGGQWQKHEATLAVGGTDLNARLVVSTRQPGTIWLDMVSLFPKETYQNRANGFRPDLVRMLQAMHPSFVRFPGGCFVEGDSLEESIRWKRTIGDVAVRPGHWCRWGYRSTDGLGFHEYLLLCEDLGAAPLFVINVGLAHRGVVPMEQIQEWVQDALDAIEYANGPADSKWGALRAQAGHPAPFHLKTIELGNENGGDLQENFGGTSAQYQERYAAFHSAIKTRYPDITLIANTRIASPVEIVDDHCYVHNPDLLLRRVGQYDGYSRNDPKVYVGEYAVIENCGLGNLKAALAEAAYAIGLERNSDAVVMACYAPLFCRKGWDLWNPNAIVFDARRVYGTPSYHVQALFAANRPDQLLASTVDKPGVYVLGGKDEKTGQIILKAVNTGDAPLETTIRIQGTAKLNPKARVITLASDKATDENTLDEPAKVAPVESVCEVVAPEFQYRLKPCSLTIFRIDTAK